MKSKISLGKSLGTYASASDLKIIRDVMQKEWAKMQEQIGRENVAMCLWVLRSEFGFGEKRLRKFYECFDKCVIELRERFEMNDGDDPWLCTKMLERSGIDLDKWENERNNKK